VNISVSLGGSAAAVGNSPGWHLSFHPSKTEGTAVVPDSEAVLELGQGDYHAEIRASLPGELEGGTYTFTIEGMTDADYKKIPRGEDVTAFVKLFLFWADANTSVGGYVANLAGLTDVLGPEKGADMPDKLVAVLQIVGVTRKAGERRYEAVITAREWVFERVSTSRLGSKQPIKKPTREDAIKELLSTAAKLRDGTDFKFVGATPSPDAPPPVPPSPVPEVELTGGRLVREILKEQGEALEKVTGCFGRGMFLIRDGCLHIGTRQAPLDGEPKELLHSNGLIETEVLAPVETDPGWDPENDGAPKKAPTRRQFRLTLKGRPDLKPGDVVAFDPPPEDAPDTGGNPLGALGDLVNAVAGGLLPATETLSDNPVNLYIAGVEHSYGRTSGFSTKVVGVELGKPPALWDKHTPARDGAKPSEAAHGSPEAEAARAVMGVARAAAGTSRPVEIAEVRASQSTGTAEPPAQTVTLWRGVTPGDPHSYRARRTPIERPSSAPATGAPYATPFAWGKCGLVLPRYPGTRVVVVHPDGKADDPIDMAAVWESGKGPDSQAGDWWLILPVGVPAADRSTAADDKTVPVPHVGPVTQDLIDADGNRVIEVGELTVRIGRDGTLKNAGERPSRGTTDAITLEHAGGASVVMDKDGKVTIKAKNIELDAGSGTITMKANKVDVAVADKMDVHG
jgi:hypothetical protein